MALLMSQKNFDKYSHNGFCYVRDRESSDGDRIFWRCEQKHNKCNGRIWTTSCENREFIRLVTEHSCSTTVNVAVQQVMTNIRRRAATTMDNPAQIRSNVVQGTSTAVLGQLQNKSAIRKVVSHMPCVVLPIFCDFGST
uniref:FLYWCH-type domain-containing protein n=2 Tax=Meloidogyne TaxID=189290 RepID=A0A6V7U0I1_MELEN|nr:unnamed protein product [Meloidogyne enterolobii]